MKIAIPVFIVFFSASVAQAQRIITTSSKDTTIYIMVDKEATFPGGIENFYKYVGQNIHYSPKAIKQQLQGRVSVYTVVEKDGSFSNIKAIRGVFPELNKEAVRVVSGSPKWIPAMINGQPVRSSFTIPIIFRLSATQDSSTVCISPEVLPTFPGGLENLYKYFTANIHYPAYAREHKEQGEVVITFIIEKDGHISNLKVLRSPAEDLTEESLRVMKACPNWIPGKLNGKLVRVQYAIPIHFRL